MSSKEQKHTLFALSNKRKRPKSLKQSKNRRQEDTKIIFQNSQKEKESYLLEALKIGKEVKTEESHYVKTLKKALEEVVDENAILRDRVTKLEALLSAAQDEIEERNEAILELNEAYEVIEQFDKEKKDQNKDC